ncbi:MULTISPECIES: hypothetical protein [Nostoc]|uniref:Uncharacterized protein n=1 Tax=Nostoc spongiaeforme FACHB-130 TaxID=1357510 RepID=A0ABR8G4X0_9NOSO|nr:MULTISPECIES: hypothetical protein [Nostoc]MBD2441313.1 hypothetical protein [Nostoc sp. FACHB-110]MBD2598323.1 hypothetical protein [Nostoc spongiaeforme FACHB-130]
MTAQISDRVLYHQKFCDITGINGSGLFEPLQYGVKPVMISSACWRGYYCTYEVADKSLFLTQLNIGLSEADQLKAEQGDGLKLFGKTPARYTEYGQRIHLTSNKTETHWESSDFKIDGIRELIPFTGGLLLGNDFIRQMYVHMGFHPAYKFRTVYELIFDHGQLVEEHDRSSQMAQLREMLPIDTLKPGVSASRNEIKQWLKQCFSLEYKGFST